MNAPTSPRHLQRPASQQIQRPASTGVDIDDLNAVMRLIAGPTGLKIRDHYYHLRRYQACFYGTELVDFLVDRCRISREQAVSLGQQLEATDRLRHVAGEHAFKDEALLFRIGPGPQHASTAESDFDLKHLAELVQAMRDRGGLPVGPRYRHFVRYPNCFRGREAVSWLASHCDIPRERATQIGRAMLQANFIQHLYDEHPFQDSALLFRFV